MTSKTIGIPKDELAEWKAQAEGLFHARISDCNHCVDQDRILRLIREVERLEAIEAGVEELYSEVDRLREIQYAALDLVDAGPCTSAMDEIDCPHCLARARLRGFVRGAE